MNEASLMGKCTSSTARQDMVANEVASLSIWVSRLEVSTCCRGSTSGSKGYSCHVSQTRRDANRAAVILLRWGCKQRGFAHGAKGCFSQSKAPVGSQMC